LARAEVAVEGEHVAGLEAGGEATAERDGLGGRGRLGREEVGERIGHGHSERVRPKRTIGPAPRRSPPTNPTLLYPTSSMSPLLRRPSGRARNAVAVAAAPSPSPETRRAPSSPMSAGSRRSGGWSQTARRASSASGPRRRRFAASSPAPQPS